jgi:hypothetical protein
VPSGATVDVALIIQAVNNALFGCPFFRPSRPRRSHQRQQPLPCTQAALRVPQGARAPVTAAAGAGRYHVCTCVNNPPGLRDGRNADRSGSRSCATLTCAPDTCAAGTAVSCDASGPRPARRNWIRGYGLH